MTVKAVEYGQLVLVRGQVARLHSQSAGVLFTTAPLTGDAELVELPLSELFLPAGTDDACDVARLLTDRIEALRDIGLRLQAEIYELAGHGGSCPRPR